MRHGHPGPEERRSGARDRAPLSLPRLRGGGGALSTPSPLLVSRSPRSFASEGAARRACGSGVPASEHDISGPLASAWSGEDRRGVGAHRRFRAFRALLRRARRRCDKPQRGGKSGLHDVTTASRRPLYLVSVYLRFSDPRMTRGLSKLN